MRNKALPKVISNFLVLCGKTNQKLTALKLHGFDCCQRRQIVCVSAAEIVVITERITHTLEMFVVWNSDIWVLVSLCYS